ncbi:MAG: DUF371 domain-containing protein [archaeon]
MIEKIVCFGHKNISASHPTTLEITKDAELSKTGDCIVGVRADRGLNELSPAFKQMLRKGRNLTVRLVAGGLEEVVDARGSPDLELSHPTEMVVRKTDFASNRTLAIRADKAAKDFSKEFKEKLKGENQQIEVFLELY